MIGAPPLACPRCAHESAPGSLTCSLCGELFAKAPRKAASAPPAPAAPGYRFAPAPAVARQAPLQSFVERREPWLVLGAGLLIAPVFGATPLLGYMGWFLASLVHEMGHSAAAWLMGMPSLPAIRLDGHAAAIHGEQMPILCGLILGLLAAALWRLPVGAWRWGGIAVLAVAYPSIAFTHWKELAFLVAGHLGEMVFAGIALWRALVQGFTGSRVERVLYATLGWYLVGKNLALTLGLARSEAARLAYAENGSFGLTNDYLRLAHEVLLWPVESVALAMTVPALLVPPLALWLGRVAERAWRR